MTKVEKYPISCRLASWPGFLFSISAGSATSRVGQGSSNRAVALGHNSTREGNVGHTVGSLASLVQGEVRGLADREIRNAAAIESAGPDAVTFVLDESHVSRLEACRAGAIILNSKIAAGIKISDETSLIVVTDPHSAFLQILPQFRKVRGRPTRGISPGAHVSPTAVIGPDCYVGPGAVIGEEVEIGSGCDIHAGAVLGPGCKLASDVIVYSNAVLYQDVTLGNRVIIHSGAVIGADGFGYRFTDGRFVKIPQLGTVEIHDDAEIGACTTIDRGAIGPTIVGAGTKLDNLIMIAHNCELGKHNVFASQVGMAGSCSTGDYVRLGGQVGIKDHVRLNSGCMVGAKGGVHKDIPEGEIWIGYPATPEAEQKRLVFSLKRVPEMRDTVRTLVKQVAALTKQLEQLQATPAEELRKAG
jgi:UDP-3-O-[3-hydroxymyristoyl] glucosamine N-acyltransferase